MDIFGFEIKRKDGNKATNEKSFVAPSDDGAIESIRAGGYYGTYLDLDGISQTESELIKRYRDIAMMADVDTAIEDIINESVAQLENESPVEINLDKVELSASIRKSISKEFESLKAMMSIQDMAQDYFRRWYIDGKIYFHKVIDIDNPKDGIKDIRYIDPRKIRRVREVKKEKNATGVMFVKDIDEYFIYNDKGVTTKPGAYVAPENQQGLKIVKDAIAYAPSGLVDHDKKIALSYLHKAIRPANQLRMMENAVVIYRITRAPERRIFYVDVGNLPKMKAEQYLKDIMDRYRNKLVYDANTGEIRDDKKFMSMLEDFWLPRREGGTSTNIDTLPAGQNLGQIEDVEYFQRKLYQALNIPMSRLEQQAGLNFGRAAEINRDEMKFTKFVDKLRRKFSVLFNDILRSQLLLKGVITEADWDLIKDDIFYEFATDAYYQESKEQEILRSRVEVMNGLSAYIGTFFSKRWIQKNVLNLTDEEIEQIEADLLLEPQLTRQYQWSPLQAQEQQQPETDINNGIPGEGVPEPGPENGA
jgi:hypothetical protein